MKKLTIILMFVLLGCGSSISNDSSPDEIINALTENYIDNKKSFSEMIDYYKENGELTFEQSLLCSEDSINIDNKEDQVVCTLHDITRTYRATSHNNNWLFVTYDNRKNGFVNAYSYLYTDSNKVLPECKKEEFDKRSKSSICYIPLNENWYIEFRYLAVE